MKQAITLFVFTLMFYYMWFGMHTLLFDFQPPFWVVLSVLFLASTLAQAIIDKQEQLEKEIARKDADSDDDE